MERVLKALAKDPLRCGALGPDAIGFSELARILILPRRLEGHFMERSSTLILQTAIVLVGMGALAILLGGPHFEGRNAHATLIQIYFNDPFLAYVYVASIAFFVALCQAFKLLGHIGRAEAFTEHALKAVRVIKYCAMTLAAFAAGAEAYLWIAVRGEDDIAGGVAIGLVMMFAFVVSAAAAAVFEGILRSAMDARIEGNLTG